MEKIYDLRPLEMTYESLQNYGKNDLNEFSIEDLKEEFIGVNNDIKDLQVEIDDMKNSKYFKYAVEERLENSKNYLKKIKNKLVEKGISEQEIKKLQENSSKYKKNKKEDEY